MTGKIKAPAVEKKSTCRTLVIEVDTVASEWKVWATYAEALVAAGCDSEGGITPDKMAQEHDQLTGLEYFKVIKVKPGVVSLDEIDESMQQCRYTWEEQLERAGMAAKAVMQNGHCKARTAEDGRIVWELPQEKPTAQTTPTPTPTSTTPTPQKKTKTGEASSKPRVSEQPRAASARRKVHSRDPSRRRHSTEEKRPVSIWGRTYIVPGRGVGQGSYHFLEGERAYLNYEHMPKHMKLEDGSPYPKRLDFASASYDAEHRKFRGVIEWTISHKSRWEYDLTFCPQLIGIRGACKMFKQGASEPYCTIRFQQEAKYVWDQAPKHEVQKYLGIYETAKDQESRQIIEAIGQALENDASARSKSGRASATGIETLGLVFGKGMMSYARDKEADERLRGGGGGRFNFRSR